MGKVLPPVLDLPGPTAASPAAWEHRALPITDEGLVKYPRDHAIGERAIVARSRPRAFSLIELVIVVVIIGIIAAIAVPRLSSSGERSREAAISASEAIFARAIEMYVAEHNGLSPADNPDGSVTNIPSVIIARLTQKTDEQGTVDANGLFGPYLRDMPINPLNRKSTIRVDTSTNLIGQNGWIFDATKRIVIADRGAGTIPGGSQSAVNVTQGGAQQFDGQSGGGTQSQVVGGQAPQD